MDITPFIGVELGGYGYYLNRKAETIHDPLYARSVMLDNGRERVVLIANDLVGVTKQTVDRARSLINYKIGIKKENIIVCASHTHSGPATGGLRGLGEPNVEYLDILPIRIATAAIIAAENLKEAKIGFGRGKIANMSYNREENPNWWIEVKRKGTIDPEVDIIRIDDMKGESLAILFNFACHGIVIDYRTEKGKAVSADYPGYAQRVEGPGGVMKTQMVEPIKVVDSIKPVQLTNPKPSVYVYDMGQNIAGWCRLNVEGPRGDGGGAKVCRNSP